jgi:hypothetical protein
MTDAYLVLITFASCAVMYGAWHWYERRSHRGGHARYDIAHSPYVLAERVEKEWAQVASARQAAGRHHLHARSQQVSAWLLAGETPLLSGRPS